MEYAERRYSILLRVAVIGGVLLFIFLVGYYGGVFRYDCAEDKGCFNERLKRCSPAMLVSVENNNVYSYEVGKSIGGKCEITIGLERVEVGASPQVKRLLEGREMECSVPKDLLDTADVENFEAIFDYCHGLLKEGLYELIIQRMYSKVVSELSDVAEEAKRVLKEA